MESTKWKKRQDAGDRVAEVAQKELVGADPGLGNDLVEDDAVDLVAGNADAPAAEEGANVLLPQSEEGEDVPKFQLKSNRHLLPHLFKFSTVAIQNSFD